MIERPNRIKNVIYEAGGRLLWAGPDPVGNVLEAYFVNGGVTIIQTFSNANGVDVFRSCPSNSAVDAGSFAVYGRVMPRPLGELLEEDSVLGHSFG